MGVWLWMCGCMAVDVVDVRPWIWAIVKFSKPNNVNNYSRRISEVKSSGKNTRRKKQTTVGKVSDLFLL